MKQLMERRGRVRRASLVLAEASWTSWTCVLHGFGSCVQRTARFVTCALENLCTSFTLMCAYHTLRSKTHPKCVVPPFVSIRQCSGVRMFSPNPSPSKARSAASTCLVVPASAMAADGTVGHVVNAQASAHALQNAALQYVAVGMSPRDSGPFDVGSQPFPTARTSPQRPIVDEEGPREESVPLRGGGGSREARIASVSVPGSKMRGWISSAVGTIRGIYRRGTPVHVHPPFVPPGPFFHSCPALRDPLASRTRQFQPGSSRGHTLLLPLG